MDIVFQTMGRSLADEMMKQAEKQPRPKSSEEAWARQGNIHSRK